MGLRCVIICTTYYSHFILLCALFCSTCCHGISSELTRFPTVPIAPTAHSKTPWIQNRHPSAMLSGSRLEEEQREEALPSSVVLAMVTLGQSMSKDEEHLSLGIK